VPFTQFKKGFSPFLAIAADVNQQTNSVPQIKCIQVVTMYTHCRVILKLFPLRVAGVVQYPNRFGLVTLHTHLDDAIVTLHIAPANLLPVTGALVTHSALKLLQPLITVSVKAASNVHPASSACFLMSAMTSSVMGALYLLFGSLFKVNEINSLRIQVIGRLRRK
jgi:hypothetical protein